MVGLVSIALLALAGCATEAPPQKGVAEKTKVYGGLENCTKWRLQGDPLRCFDCMKKVWNGREWEWANICPPTITPFPTFGSAPAATGPAISRLRSGAAEANP